MSNTAHTNALDHWTLSSLPVAIQARVERATSVILFGSRSAGVAHEASDWDILCVGEGRTSLSFGLDVVWLSRERLGQSSWLGSELAHHVARYGTWLTGDDSWRFATRTSQPAIDRKLTRLVSDLKRVDSMGVLLPHVARRRDTFIRRDLQRLDLLGRYEPVPPTPTLDAAFRAWSSPEWTRIERMKPLFPALVHTQLMLLLERLRAFGR